MNPPARFHSVGARACSLVFSLVIVTGCDAGPGGPGCDEREPGLICPVAGTGETGFNRDGKAPDETDFFLITKALRGPDESLYFIDFNNWRIRRLYPDNRIRTIAGNGFHASPEEWRRALKSPFDNPTDAVFLPDGRMAVVSFEDPRVIAIDDGVVRVLAGQQEPGIVGDEGDGGDPLQAQFIELTGIAADDEGTIFVADAGAHRIRKIEDGIITTIAGNGEAGFSGDEGPATFARLNLPTAIALGPDGALYIADSLNHAIRKVDPAGEITTVAGTGEPGLSGDGAAAVLAELNQPNGVAVGPDGTVYVADRANFRVREISPDGIITTLAGTVEGNSGDEGPAVEAELGYLARLSLDRESLLVADQSNSVVRRIYLERR